MLYCSSCRKTRENTEFYRKNKTYKTCNNCFNRRLKNRQDKSKKENIIKDLLKAVEVADNPNVILQRSNKMELWGLYILLIVDYRGYHKLIDYNTVTKNKLIEYLNILIDKRKLGNAYKSNNLLRYGELITSRKTRNIQGDRLKVFYGTLKYNNSLYNTLLNKNIFKMLNELNVVYPSKTLKKYLCNDALNIVNSYLEDNRQQLYFKSILALQLYHYKNHINKNALPVLKNFYKLRALTTEDLEYITSKTGNAVSYALLL